MKIKGGPEMENCFEQLFKISNPRKPEKLQRGAGKEFLNKDLQIFLKSKAVHHLVSHRDKCYDTDPVLILRERQP